MNRLAIRDQYSGWALARRRRAGAQWYVGGHWLKREHVDNCAVVHPATPAEMVQIKAMTTIPKHIRSAA